MTILLSFMQDISFIKAGFTTWSVRRESESVRRADSVIPTRTRQAPMNNWIIPFCPRYGRAGRFHYITCPRDFLQDHTCPANQEILANKSLDIKRKPLLPNFIDPIFGSPRSYISIALWHVLIMNGDKSPSKATLTLCANDADREKHTGRDTRDHTAQLAERIKELDCLYAISKVFEKPESSFNERMDAIVSLLPKAWHYPEIASARIRLAGKTYQSSGFQETPWRQRSPILSRGQQIGDVDVVYSEGRPPLDEGPFLREERALIDAVAGRLSRFYERHVAQRQLEESENRYRAFIENIPIAVCRSTPGPNGRLLMANTRMAEMFGYDSVEDFTKIHASDLYKNPEQRGLFSQSLLDRGDAGNQPVIGRVAFHRRIDEVEVVAVGLEGDTGQGAEPVGPVARVKL